MRLHRSNAPLLAALALVLAVHTRSVAGFTPAAKAVAVVNGACNKDVIPTKQSRAAAMSPLEPKDVVTTVAVAGATGRTGRVVVEELINRGVTEVVALVRDVAAAEEVFPNAPNSLKITKCDLANEKQLSQGMCAICCAFFVEENEAFTCVSFSIVLVVVKMQMQPCKEWMLWFGVPLAFPVNPPRVPWRKPKDYWIWHSSEALMSLPCPVWRDISKRIMKLQLHHPHFQGWSC